MMLRAAIAGLEWASFGTAHTGGERSGDAAIVEPCAGGVLFGVVDGLGHGDPAADVAEQAVAVAREHAGKPVEIVVQACHDALLGSRGVVLTIGMIEPRTGRVAWVGVGNVEAMAIHAPPRPRSSLGLRGGVVGGQLPKLHVSGVALDPGDVLVLATDGVRAGYGNSVRRGDSAAEIAHAVHRNYQRGNDDALVLALRWVGPP